MLPLVTDEFKPFTACCSDLCKVLQKPVLSLLHCGIDFAWEFRYPCGSKGVDDNMGERELLDMMIAERIQILVKEMKPYRESAEREKALLLMRRAEGLLKQLSEQDRTLMEE